VGGTITNARTLDNWGWVINCGLVENQAGGTITNQVGGTTFNDGTFDNGSGTFSNSGRYQGTGTFIGTLDSGSGTIAPGNSAGAMTVDGDFVLSAGTLEIEIGGFEAGEYDVLDITGAASLLTGGTIELLFLGTYDITTDLSCGESLSLMFLEADGGITGWPSAVSYDFWGTPSGFAYDVYQQDNGLWFQATNTNMPGPDIETIPAPGAGLLTGLGAALVGWCRRRQST